MTPLEESGAGPAPALRLSYPTPPRAQPARPIALIATGLTAALAGAILGAATNAINGVVSPAYFISVLGWPDDINVWRASIAQGVLEGLVVGMIGSALFTLTIGLLTRATCTYRFAVRYLGLLVIFDCILWALGGMAGVALAAFSPGFFRATYIGVPAGSGPLLRYAWVGGSILGIELGGFIALIAVLILFAAGWRRGRRQNAEGLE